MKTHLSFVLAWALSASAAHLGKGARDIITGPVGFWRDYKHNGYEDRGGQHAGPSVTRCDDPLPHTGGPLAVLDKLAEWKDCQSILDHMDKSWTGHGQWNVTPSDKQDPIAVSGSCAVSVYKQADSEAKWFEFGSEDLRHIISGTRHSDLTWNKGRMKCGDAMIVFMIEGI